MVARIYYFLFTSGRELGDVDIDQTPFRVMDTDRRRWLVLGRT